MTTREIIKKAREIYDSIRYMRESDLRIGDKIDILEFDIDNGKRPKKEEAISILKKVKKLKKESDEYDPTNRYRVTYLKGRSEKDLIVKAESESQIKEALRWTYAIKTIKKYDDWEMDSYDLTKKPFKERYIGIFGKNGKIT